MFALLSFFKTKAGIYIFPTKLGGYLNGLIFLLFLLSVGYGNNLLLLLTLFLFGLNLLWVIQSYFHSRHLEVERLVIEDSHQASQTNFDIFWVTPLLNKENFILRLFCDEGYLDLFQVETNEYKTSGILEFTKRGQWRWRSILISSERPFGFYRTYRMIPLDGKSFVYPPLIKGEFHFPLFPLGDGLDFVDPHSSGHDEIKDFRPYEGEEARRINWKLYAKTAEIFIKEGEDYKGEHAYFKWDLTQTPNKEYGLSHMATNMVYCYKKGIPFIFEMDGKKRGPALSKFHLVDCLRDLSLC
jgi:uncharacterized protein (DUF58 family)